MSADTINILHLILFLLCNLCHIRTNNILFFLNQKHEQDIYTLYNKKSYRLKNKIVFKKTT